MKLPAQASLCEVGPRDGFQYETTPIPTELKLELIGALVEAGLRRVQAVSFVHPARVPQMADAEAVVRGLPAVAGVVYSGLVLNLRGMERAAAAGLRQVDISIATHDRHSLENAGMTAASAAAEAEAMVGLAQEAGMAVQVGFQTVFGYARPGDTPLERVVALARHFAAMGVESVSLADTTGMANPRSIRAVVEAVRAAVGAVPLVLHLHDTRGLGLANLCAALEAGVARFDTSFGGLGGCPFLAGASGNVATEDVVYLLESLGVATGIDRAAVAACSRRMEAHLGRPLDGKLYRLDA